MISLIALLATSVLGASIDPYAIFRPRTDDQGLPVGSLCGADDSVEAKCLVSAADKTYETARAVLRVRKNNRAHCTAWLIGEAGHVITNNHCIGDASEAASLTFEAMAEGADCSVNCRKALGCPGTFVHSEPLKFIATGGSTDQDWTLLQLPEATRQSVLARYGYLRLRKSGPVVGERIYIVGHPSGYGKRISLKDGDKDATILSTSQNTGCGTSEVIYKADTEGGSSGSPVIAYNDNLVVAIHHCGGCSDAGNSAVDLDKLYNGLKDLVPASTFV